MSDEQEMQFADPAWQPKVTREFEALSPLPPPAGASQTGPGGGAATSAQSGEAEYYNYAQGYGPRSRPEAEYENPSQNQPPPPLQGPPPPLQGQQPGQFSFQDLYRRLPAWAWWVIGVMIIGSLAQSGAAAGGTLGALFVLLCLGLLVFVGWLLYTRRMRISLTGEAQAAETRTFTVGARPTIILKNRAGAIKLRSGDEGQVSITTTRRGYLFSPRFDRDMPIQYHQDSAANTVTARIEDWRPFGKNAITFEVVVPLRANLQLSTNFGQIVVQNVAGQMTLRSEAGTIRASDVALQGQSSLRGKAGTIFFAGSLDPAGSYKLATELGTIDANLPADASFDLRAKTGLGTITSNFPVARQKGNRASGPVGPGPHPRFRVKTELGTITIKRG